MVHLDPKETREPLEIWDKKVPLVNWEDRDLREDLEGLVTKEEL